MTIARELSKFPHEVGRMPYSDARDMAEWMGELAGASRQTAEPMTPADIRAMRELANG